MSGYFKEIIFPRKERVQVISSPSPSITGMTETNARAMFEVVYCGKKSGWYSMVECVGCTQANKTLEEILENEVGCEVE